MHSVINVYRKESQHLQMRVLTSLHIMDSAVDSDVELPGILVLFAGWKTGLAKQPSLPRIIFSGETIPFDAHLVTHVKWYSGAWQRHDKMNAYCSAHQQMARLQEPQEVVVPFPGQDSDLEETLGGL